jgi:Zn-dependent M28 family amino/carboxypeptidase
MWGISLLILISMVASWNASNRLQPDPHFDGHRANQAVRYQVFLGPRTPGSLAYNRFMNWAVKKFANTGWEVEVQETSRRGKTIRNIIAKRGAGTPWIVLGAHYDSRLLADQDPDPAKRTEPVPGANDGASGVAVLLELARVLPEDLDKQVWLVLFDAEDNGNISGWDWIMGSQAFVDSLEDQPDGAVIVDMVGDSDLNIYLERNSDPDMTAEIWAQAARLGHEDQFIPIPKHAMIDDHTPFLNAGIPAVDIIDFDYPYWHTSEDTPDKVSAKSLQAVGEVLYAWLLAED